MEKYLIQQCGDLLARNKMTIALAESASAGLVTGAFSLCVNSGEFLMGGIVCYDANIKKQLLQVSPELVETFTPESPEVTFAITKGLASLIPADLHIGITGLTRPGGSETKEKPVGTIFFCGLFGENKLFEEKVVFQGSQELIIDQAIAYLAKLLIAHLETKNGQ